MSNIFTWIVVLILQCAIVTSQPLRSLRDTADISSRFSRSAQNIPKYEDGSNGNEQVISVRITSSIAVGRGRGKPSYKIQDNNEDQTANFRPITSTIETTISPSTLKKIENTENVMTDIPPNLAGANIEYIKQLNAKRGLYNPGFQHNIHNNPYQRHEEPIVESTTSFEIAKLKDNDDDSAEDVPLETLLPLSSTNKEIDRNDRAEQSQVFTTQSDSYKHLNATVDPIIDKSNDYDDILSTGETIHSYNKGEIQNQNFNDTDDSVAESSIKSVLEIANVSENDENIPLARSVPLSLSSKNYIQGLANKQLSERGNSPRLTTVSFNIVHDTPKINNNYNEPSNTNASPKFYEPPKVYSQPAQIYSEPAKIYSEPAKIYSEPAKIYSEPAKVYSEPAKIYSEPAKFYSQPASLHLTPNVPPNYTPWQPQAAAISSTISTTPVTTVNTQPNHEHQPEKNYEIDEKISVLSDGRSHGVQESTTENCRQDKCKVGYVVEGRQFKKYRVEERTSDGFIVGEYGVVRNEDGALRGVRYTADSDASHRLIDDALMKFLQLR